MGFDKTAFGRRALQTREVRLSPCQRAIFVMVNGQRDLTELLSAAASMGGGQADIDQLLALGMIEPNELSFSPALPTSSPELVQELIQEPSDDEDADLWLDDSLQEGGDLAPLPMAPLGERFAQVKETTLALLAPLGLREIHLRRMVEASETPDQLQELASMVRTALGPKTSPAFSAALATLG